MYTSFFGLKENPFNLTPDPRYLFLSPYHQEAFDHLLYGINERKGFIAITGGIGTGKTTLCRALLSHLDASTKSAMIFGTFISDMELLRTITQEFDIEVKGTAESKKDYIDELNQFLLKTHSSGGNAVLLLDEAQNLSHPVLEQIRMLSNLETEKEKLIQIVLMGQSELKEILFMPSLRQLNERITVRYDLKPLDRQDIKGYVEHRLVVAGGQGNLRFTNGALSKIYLYSRGNPRRINAVCDRALLTAYTKEKQTVSKGMAEQAVEDMGGDLWISSRITGPGMRRVASGALWLFLLILVTGIAGWNFREDLQRWVLHEQRHEVVKTKQAPIRPPKPKKRPVSLYLDEQFSFAQLFKLFNPVGSKNSMNTGDSHLGLVTLDIAPEYYVMFKKPFRVRLSKNSPTPSTTPRYLLIREVTEEGAVAIDEKGDQRTVTRDFLLKHWGHKVSWVYPYKNKNVHLMKGMSDPDVEKVQMILNEMGYLVDPTGFYGELTLRNVLRFQKDFGLKTDGIVGPQTRALLFQMADRYEHH